MYIYINIYNIKSNHNIKYYNIVVLTQHAYKACPVSIFHLYHTHLIISVQQCYCLWRSIQCYCHRRIHIALAAHVQLLTASCAP